MFQPVTHQTARRALLILLFGSSFVLSAGAQTRRPASGEKLPSVQPVYEGWFTNPDGTVTLSYGYINREGINIEVPIGPANSFSPGPENRGQPTTFLPGTQRNVALIVVPANFAGNVIWTITSGGIAATTTQRGGLNPIYVINDLPPSVDPILPEGSRLTRLGDVVVADIALQHPAAARLRAAVKNLTPLPTGTSLKYQWAKRSGPGDVTFSPLDGPETSATFSQPGEYLVRLTVSRPSGMDSLSNSATFRVFVK